jgi:hypothetical protein
MMVMMDSNNNIMSTPEGEAAEHDPARAQLGDARHAVGARLRVAVADERVEEAVLVAVAQRRFACVCLRV